MFSILLRKFALAFMLVAIASGTVALAQTGGLTGKVTDEKGEILVGYPIVIERVDVKGTYATKTDKKGQYIYIGLPIGQYKITLQDPSGKVIYFFNQIRVGLGDPTTLNFDLAKEKAMNQKTQQASPEVKKQMEEQAKEQKQFGSLKQVFDQATALYDQQKYAEAAALYEQAIPLAKEKNLAIVQGRLADCYRKAKDYDKAVAAYQKWIEADPTEAKAHDGLGNAYADLHKTAEAQAEFQKAAELNPQEAAREYFNLGAVMYNQNKMEEAANAFKKATDADPKYAEAFFLEAQALMYKVTMTPDGKVVAAPGTTEALEAYLKLEPNGKHAGDAQQILQTLQAGVQTQYKVTKKKK